ncbi:MAG TPA: phosphopantetheine-binding protein [Candidatus Binatia bacterium]|nr:phosphopantetheine-binding protein [Candidatus Binatia bacterium]
MSAAQSPAEKEMAELIVTALNIEHVTADKIAPGAPLFGSHTDGLGLDSIDALEIALAVSERYGVQLRADDANNKQVFSSLGSLTDFVHRQKRAAA